MRITTTALLAAGLLGLTSSLFAAGQIPDRGMTQDAVRKQFGNPTRQVAPVGTPPISRWVYDDFTVYFEGRLAIHAVQHAATLTTPAPAAQAESTDPAAEVVDELPAIEDVSPSETPADAEAAPVPAENTFRFDPASGRIIEIGPDGKPLNSPAAQTAPEPAPVVQPAQATQPEEQQQQPEAEAEAEAENAVEEVAPKDDAPANVSPASAPADSATSLRFDPSTGRMIEVDTNGNPVQAEPAAQPEPEAPAINPAEAETPEAETFEPAAPTETVESSEPALPEKTIPAEPADPALEESSTQAPATETSTQPAAEGGRFRFDPATGRIVMDEPEQQKDE